MIKLHYSVVGPELGHESPRAPAVVLLHGLFGMGGNLGSLARSLREDFRVYSIDLPGHGRSDWLKSMDIPAMARCVVKWMDEQHLPRAHFVGHSLGGKVAMELALRNSHRVTALCVADIAPVPYRPHHDDVLAALQAVADTECRSRQEAAEILASFLSEDMVVQFLLMSIVRHSDGRYRWRFDLRGIIANYDAIRAGITAEEPFTRDVLFIKGGDSDYILPQHRDTILGLFPRATVKVMPGCGHWLHVQQARLFNNIVRRFLVPLKDDIA